MTSLRSSDRRRRAALAGLEKALLRCCVQNKRDMSGNRLTLSTMIDLHSESFEIWLTGDLLLRRSAHTATRSAHTTRSRLDYQTPSNRRRTRQRRRRTQQHTRPASRAVPFERQVQGSYWRVSCAGSESTYLLGRSKLTRVDIDRPPATVAHSAPSFCSDIFVTHSTHWLFAHRAPLRRASGLSSKR